jgi:hypothetical protein
MTLAGRFIFDSPPTNPKDDRSELNPDETANPYQLYNVNAVGFSDLIGQIARYIPIDSSRL